MIQLKKYPGGFDGPKQGLHEESRSLEAMILQN